ncbi:DUF6766 family protein [Bosea sp. 124]|uniref:DUF6766 family protein n=1 Tax=Bosea sp. 124 TaxID=2135642 RepID=UPI000D384969|nr:DUF6766 family protein [Bosea sp. 124]PTM39566.1 hypothetical protein C8D03_1068 [Bosea sp. 124]
MFNQGCRAIARENGLTIVLALMFLVSLIGMAGTGVSAFNELRIAHGMEGLSLGGYLTSGAFVSALFENWESEFLQMASYVMLTAVLVQRGSAESKDPDEKAEESAPAPRSPWPAKRGGWLGWLYGRSLGLSLLALFIISFCLHWWGSLHAANADAVLHGKPTTSGFDYLIGAQFWFESFQNWQSEFLSTAVLVVLSIFLRQKGSPESKPVNAPHRQTGA